METPTPVIKIVFMGPPAVGKTSIRKRYLGQGFSSSHNITIGADISIKKASYKEKEVMLQIWDLSGQPSFYEVRKLYYRGANGLFIVFDLSDFNTLDVIPKWIEEYKNHSFRSKISVLLIGNKLDLIDEDAREVKNKVMKHTKELGIDNFIGSNIALTSALTGENIEQAFELIIGNILDTNTDVVQ